MSTMKIIRSILYSNSDGTYYGDVQESIQVAMLDMPAATHLIVSSRALAKMRSVSGLFALETDFNAVLSGVFGKFFNLTVLTDSYLPTSFLPDNSAFICVVADDGVVSFVTVTL